MVGWGATRGDEQSRRHGRYSDGIQEGAVVSSCSAFQSSSPAQGCHRRLSGQLCREQSAQRKRGSHVVHPLMVMDRDGVPTSHCIFRCTYCPIAGATSL